MKKPSFLQRLTGSVKMGEYDEVLSDDHEFSDVEDTKSHEEIEDSVEFDGESEWSDHNAVEDSPEIGELPVDMYHTRDTIIIRALVAGVGPGDLDIAITRDMVTIQGVREEVQEAPDEDYYHRELFWGGFSRKILLPEEVVIDESEAKEKHGLLEIILPKLDKARTTQLKVKSHQK